MLRFSFNGTRHLHTGRSSTSCYTSFISASLNAIDHFQSFLSSSPLTSTLLSRTILVLLFLSCTIQFPFVFRIVSTRVLFFFKLLWNLFIAPFHFLHSHVSKLQSYSSPPIPLPAKLITIRSIHSTVFCVEHKIITAELFYVRLLNK